MKLHKPKAVADAVLMVCRRLQELGARPYLVGGCVRDMVLGLEPTDFDIEVYGLPLEQVTKALTGLGRCEQVGKSFGVLKVWMKGLEIDVALPRTERKIGKGHRGFEVHFDPHLDPEQASSRRDFTINALMLDPLSGKILDFHGGRDDLRCGALRHISQAFSEDPLRVLRGMQLASRFGLKLDGQTAVLCRKLLTEADSLAIERIWGEWKKWADGDRPSHGMAVLQETGWIGLYPELEALIDCPQEPKWHPEGDVWSHTLQVLDQAAGIALRYQWQRERRQQLLFAALIHDMGKPGTTFPDEQGRIRSMEHSIEGMEIGNSFMQRIGAPQPLIQPLLPLVKEHLTHMHGQPTARAVRRLANRLEPADIELWEALVEADASGRSPLPPSRPALEWLEQARAMHHHQSKPKSILTGHMLTGLGIKPGPEMGEIIRVAYEAQLDGLITDEKSALEWCKDHLGGL